MLFTICILLAGSIGIMTVNASPSPEDIKEIDDDNKQADKDSQDVQSEEHIGEKMITPVSDKDKDIAPQADECDKPNSKACKTSQQDNNDASDEEVAKKNAKDGGDLTVILKLKYSLTGKFYKKVHVDIGKYFSKFYDLSSKPTQIKVKHLNVPEGKTFKVSFNNYGTDEGEQWYMRNSVCKCPETRSIRVP
jgi:uncharacterized protein (DUF608 family)